MLPYRSLWVASLASGLKLQPKSDGLQTLLTVHSPPSQFDVCDALIQTSAWSNRKGVLE